MHVPAERVDTVALWIEVDDLIWRYRGVKPLYIQPSTQATAVQRTLYHRVSTDTFAGTD
jgi:hypothetical protein